VQGAKLSTLIYLAVFQSFKLGHATDNDPQATD
jgi:hypothetical protein